MYNSLSPRRSAKRVQRTSGVKPELNPVRGSPVIGRSSRYRHKFFGRRSISSRLTRMAA